MSDTIPLNGLAFRTVRIGTLKTFALSHEDGLKFDAKRMKFSVTFRSPSNVESNSGPELVKIIIPCKHITLVKSYLGRGCPVIWLQTSDECTRYLHKVTGMKQGRIPTSYYDPKSKVMSERYIAIIAADDPIPYNNVYLFKQIVQKVAETKDISEEEFHQRLQQSVCNMMLVEVTKVADHIMTFQKKVKANPDIDINANIPQEIRYSASLQKEGSLKLTRSNLPPKTVLTKATPAPSVEAPPPPEVLNKPELPTPLSSPTSTTKNVNRARKSIPKSNRSISLESQLDEIRAKAGLNTNTKLVRSISSDRLQNKESGDDTGNSSSASSTTAVKKKRPKDPFLWKGKSKKRFTVKKSSYASETYHPLGCPSPRMGQTLRTPLTTSSATSEHNTKSRIQIGEESIDEISGRYDATSLCLCLEQSPFVVFAGRDEVKCMAFENVDGRLTSCTNVVETTVMTKASRHVPDIALCEEHKERMIRHECCPGCGTFCAGGSFLICVNTKECPHRFHKECLLLHRQTKDCLHCRGPMSLVREVQIEPRQDHKLRWVIAGHDPQKMEKKRLTANREKTARMGHRSKSVKSSPPRGIVKLLRPGVSIDTSTLPEGKDRDELEDAICKYSEISGKKIRVSVKLVTQLVQQGDLMKILQFLSESDEQDVKSILKSPATLNKAVTYGKVPIVYLLCLAGANLCVKDTRGKSALFYAVERENVELIQYLLSCGIDLKQKDIEGMSCFHQAAKYGRIISCAVLLQHDPDIINMTDDGGWTPVVWAAEHGQTDTAKFLEYFAADVEKTDQEGNKCLHWAVLSGNLDLLMMCLQKKCDVNFKNKHGDTALHIAARRDHSNCVICLVCWGADINSKNNEGKTPLESSLAETKSYLLLKTKSRITETMANQGVVSDKEKLLSADISRGFENLPVSCVNSVDDCCLPTAPGGFKYVTVNVHTSQDTIIKDPANKMQSCQCYSHCTNGTCLCCLLSERCGYDEDGLLVPEFDLMEPPLVFECSETCWCPPSCRNRVVQKGISYNLQIHRTRSMGWSVRTLDTIPRGAFVCEYVGELISDAEADIREDDSYLFDLENKDGEIFCIDARYYGNVSRFINHLCDPNLVPIRVFVDHHDIRFPRLAYFSTKMIKAGEELGFDYGDRFWDVKSRQFTCGCGLPQCKYSEEAYRLKKELEEKQRNQELQEEVTDNACLSDTS